MKPPSLSIIGAGTMGANIALSFASHGFGVRVMDLQAAQLDQARATVAANAAFLERQGLLPGGAAALAEITWHRQLDEILPGAEWVLEAVSENLELKRRIFADLDRRCPPETILASNTSTFIPSRLAAGLAHPERVVILHYWNPAHLIPLVEVVPHAGTAPAVLARAEKLLTASGKRPVVLGREVAGFIGNRLAFALQREAMDLVARGVATPDDIDTVVRTGFGRRVPVTGVFGTADLGGLDVYLAICDSLFPELCRDQAAPEALRALVAQGRLGLKSGAGWRAYTPEQAAALRAAVAEELLRHAKRDRPA